MASNVLTPFSSLWFILFLSSIVALLAGVEIGMWKGCKQDADKQKKTQKTVRLINLGLLVIIGVISVLRWKNVIA